MVEKTWDDFKSHFNSFYGSDVNKHSTIEKLLNCRQCQEESFQRFAFEMDFMFRKVYGIEESENSRDILSFISERALPSLKPHLLGCSATTLYELVQFGAKLEPSKGRSDGQKHSDFNSKGWKSGKGSVSGTPQSQTDTQRVQGPRPSSPQGVYRANQK